MKVSILTLGTRGDVQPYAVLGEELKRRGHETVICTGGSFRSLIEGRGLGFVKAELDLMAILQTPEGQAVYSHPLRNLRETLALTREKIQPAYEKTLRSFYEAAKGADCLVYHPKALWAVDIALALGIPCVSMPPVPVTYPVPELPCLALTAKNLGPVLNRASYAVSALGEKGQMGLLNDFRRECLHLGKRRAGLYAERAEGREIPTVYPVSPLLFPEVKSWEGHVLVPGFFFEEEEEIREEEVLSFLREGAPPLAVCLGSLPLNEEILPILRKALEKTDGRAILVTGKEDPVYREERILSVKALPHGALFPLCGGVVHPGGAGTLAAALRAGIPQLLFPAGADHPFWAARLQKLSLAPPPIRRWEDLMEGILRLQDPALRGRTRAFGEEIRRERGKERAAQYLEELEKR